MVLASLSSPTGPQPDWAWGWPRQSITASAIPAKRRPIALHC
jgi:hypothetical protein